MHILNTHEQRYLEVFYLEDWLRGACSAKECVLRGTSRLHSRQFIKALKHMSHNPLMR